MGARTYMLVAFWFVAQVVTFASLPSASAPDNAAVEACPAIGNGVCELAKAFRSTCASHNAAQCCPVCQELIVKGRSSSDCMNPSHDDVESMKCECMSGFQHCEIEFEADDNAAKRVCCLHKFFCNWDSTCEDWKEEFCPVQFCPAEAGTEAVGSERRLSAEEIEADTSNTKLEDSFDFSGWDTVPKNRRSLGKCSDGFCFGGEDCVDVDKKVPRRRRVLYSDHEKCAKGTACCPLEYPNPYTPTRGYGQRQPPYDPTFLGKDYTPCKRVSEKVCKNGGLHCQTNHGYRRLNADEIHRLNACTKLNLCEQMKQQIKSAFEIVTKAEGYDYKSLGVYTPEQLETIRLQEIKDHEEEARLIEVKQAQALAWKDGGHCR